MEKEKKYIYDGQELTFKELVNDNGWYYLFQNQSLNIVLILCRDFHNQ